LSQRTGIVFRLTNFTDDFKDGVPVAQLLISHIPHLETSHFSYFSVSCSTAEQLQGNWRIINAVMSDIYASSAIQVPVDQASAGESSLEILLLLLFLYQTLPHFIPKASIDFHGCLHDDVIKHIELTNPSNKSLTYIAKLDGSVDFQLVDPSPILLQPKSTAKIPIKFLSRFSRPSSARLTLFTKRMGLNNSSILIFDLKGSVEPPTPIKIYKVDAQLYASPPVTIDLEVTNPLPIKGKFKVCLLQSRVSQN
jgi:hypothetical protein